MYYHNRQGSVEDVRCSVKRATCIEDLKASLADEAANRNRSSVIQLLKSRIKKIDQEHAEKDKH